MPNYPKWETSPEPVRRRAEEGTVTQGELVGGVKELDVARVTAAGDQGQARCPGSMAFWNSGTGSDF